MATAHPEIAGLTDWTPLARGGFATVWKARQVTLDRLVAVKVDQRTLDADKEQRRFLREAGAAGRLSGHPGIVTVHDAGILPDDRPYLVMELCPGGSLTSWLKEEGRPTERRVRDVGVRIADALAAAHARGVLHRDVKPANILIDSYDNPGLADFGLAAIPAPGADLSVTMEALTPAYAPREVFYQRPPNEFGDVYSLAATLYALLARRPPRWPTDSSAPSLPEILELQRLPIDRLPEVTPAFMDLLLEALADEPEDRPTAAQFRDRLAGLDLPGEDTDPGAASYAAFVGREHPTDDPGTVVPPRRDRNLLVLAVILVVLAVLVASAVAWTRRSGAPPASAGSAATVPSAVPASPTAAATEPTESPTTIESPTLALPDGFTRCPNDLGKDNFCVTTPECWNDYQQFFDILGYANAARCDRRHLYQSFAAGLPSRSYRTESQFQADPQVRRLCRRETLAKVIDSDEIGQDWRIIAMPPPTQISDDPLFRCLVGTGEVRRKDLKLTELD